MPTNGGPRALVAGNWKMHGTTASLGELRLLTTMLKGVRLNCDVLVCPPATLLMAAHRLTRQSPIGLGGQDCHAEVSGAHTGDVAAEMLRDAGATYVIVGHSERRTDHGETDKLVSAKASAAHRAGLTAIICIGETEQERRDGTTLQVVKRQLETSLPAPSRSEAAKTIWSRGH